MTFIMLQRESPTLDWLLRTRPTAFLLLTLIARRAKRSDDHPDKTLEVGEAFIGDYQSYGVTERIYRTDKACLETNGLATFKATNRGTIAKLASTAIFDINAEDVTSKATPKRQANDGQTTTNNNDKNEKNNIRPSSYSSLKALTPEVLGEIAARYRVSVSAVKQLREELELYCSSKGKTYKDYRAALMNWTMRRIEEGKLQPLSVTSGGSIMEALRKAGRNDL